MEFQPLKRMRKRKELNALRSSSNGKAGGRHFKKSSGHELVRMDSDSTSLSDDEDYINAFPSHTNKMNQCSCCTYLVYFNTFLTCCSLIFCGVLLWFYFNLKTENNSLGSIFSSVESNRRNNADEFQALHTKLRLANDNISTLALNVKQLKLSVKKTSRELKTMKSNFHQLESIGKLKPELLELPENFKTLEETVAGLGSSLKTITTDSSDHKQSMKASFENNFTNLEKNLTSVANRLANIQQEVDALTSEPTKQPPNNNKIQKRSVSQNSQLSMRISRIENQFPFDEKVSLGIGIPQNRIEKVDSLHEAVILTRSEYRMLQLMWHRVDHALLLGQLSLNSTMKSRPLPWIQNAKEAKAEFNIWDQNSDGRLSREEFNFLKTYLAPFWNPKWRFEQSDRDADGYLSQKEASCMLVHSHNCTPP